MKKLILGLALCAITASLSSQSVNPRYGITKNKDNTGRVLTFGANTVTPTSTLVSVTAASVNYFESVLSVAANTISPTFTIAVGSSFYADKLTIVTPSVAASRTVAFSTNFLGNSLASTASNTNLAVGTTTSQVVPSGKIAVFRFVFDGIRWVEIGRTVQE